jgi:hypothetical protein
VADCEELRFRSDATLLPAWSTPTHTTLPGDGRTIEAASTDGDGCTCWSVSGMPASLESGVTRGDAGGWNGIVCLKEGIARGLQPAAHQAAGRPLTIGGHCWMMGGQADGVKERQAVRAWWPRAPTDQVGPAAAAPWQHQGARPTPWRARAVDEAHRLGAGSWPMPLPCKPVDALDGRGAGALRRSFGLTAPSIFGRTWPSARCRRGLGHATLDGCGRCSRAERRNHETNSTRRQTLEAGGAGTHAQVCRLVRPACSRRRLDAGWKVAFWPV